MFILAIFGALFIYLIFSFWTTNDGRNWDEKMENLDKKILYQKTTHKTLEDISVSCHKIMNDIGSYYAWVEEVSGQHMILPQSIIEENERKQIKAMTPLFVCKLNFLEDLKKAFYSHAFNAKRVTDSAGYWNSMWRKSYDEAMSLKADNIRLHFEMRKEEILSFVTIKTNEIQLILDHKCTSEDNYVHTEDLTKMINLINTVNKNK